MAEGDEEMRDQTGTVDLQRSTTEVERDETQWKMGKAVLDEKTTSFALQKGR